MSGVIQQASARTTRGVPVRSSFLVSYDRRREVQLDVTTDTQKDGSPLS